MRILNGSLIVLIAAIAANAVAGDINISQYDLLRPADFELRSDGAKRSLSFSAGGSDWRLDLVPNAQLISQLDLRPMAGIYKGTLSGRDNTWVRLSFRDGSWSGVIFDGTEHFALDIQPSHSAGGRTVKFYALKNAVTDPGSMTCAVEGLPIVPTAENLQDQFNTVTEELRTSAAVTATRSVDIAMLGDSSFATEHAADPEAALVERLNIVDGYFSDQVGVQFNVIEYRVLDGAADPFTTDDAGDLLDEVSDFKFNDTALQPLGLLHLYTGRNLDGTTVGIAFTEALCSQRFGVALSEGTRNAAFDSLIFAHEFGHSFGAPHDGDPARDCAATPETFLMAPALNGSSTFSDCSLNEISSFLATRSCLTVIAAVDVVPLLSGFPTQVGTGADFSGNVSVRNTGSSAATPVTLTIEPQAGIQLNQSTLPGGCAPAGTGATCTIASIAGGSQSPLSQFDFTATGTTTSEIVATATASGDGNLTNDQRAQLIGITPTVDLGASLTGPASLTLGSVGTYEIGAANPEAVPATNVDLVFTVPQELTIVSAQSPCSVGNGSVTCALSSVAAGVAVNFDVALMAATAGNSLLSVNAQADETDPDNANNTQQLNVNISDPTVSTVDLAVTIAGNAALTTGNSSDYTFTVSNSSNEAAGEVDLAINVPSTLNSMVAPAGCTITGTTVDCDLGSIAAAADGAVVLTIEATSVGNQNLSATVTTSSNDSNSANDSATQAVDVTDPPPPPPPPPSGDSSSGGGAPAPLGLLTLFAVALARRRAAS